MTRQGMAKVAQTERGFRIFYAKVLLRESAARRHHPANRAFHWFLFNSACAATRQATRTPPHLPFVRVGQSRPSPAQPDLFEPANG